MKRSLFLLLAAGCAHVEPGPTNEARIDQDMRYEPFTDQTPGADGIALLEKVPEGPAFPDWEWNRYLSPPYSNPFGHRWGFRGGVRTGSSTSPTTFGGPVGTFSQQGGVRFNLGPTLAEGGRHF